MNEQNLIEQLRATFPELEQHYKALLQSWAVDPPPGKYTVVGSVFTPVFQKELEKRAISDFLERSATFFERLCTSGDPEAINVICVEVFEWLIFRRKELELLWPALGPGTKAKIKDAARRWSDAGRYFGHTENLPENNLPKK